MSDRRLHKEGPGAATTATELPVIEVESHGGHALEPEWKRLPIGPNHILYLVVVGLALTHHERPTDYRWVQVIQGLRDYARVHTRKVMRWQWGAGSICPLRDE